MAATVCHSTWITVQSTDSTSSKVLDPIHDSSTVHISLYGNTQFRVHFVLVFAQPSMNGNPERETSCGFPFQGTRNPLWAPVRKNPEPAVGSHSKEPGTRCGLAFERTRNPLWAPVRRNPEPAVGSRSKEPGTRCGLPFEGTRNPLWVPVPENPEPTAGSGFLGTEPEPDTPIFDYALLDE